MTEVAGEQPPEPARGGTRRARTAPAALLFTVLGEFVLPTGGAAWTSAFIDVLGRLGVEEKAARQALMRTAADGWLAAERVGRRTRWRLTPAGERLLTDGTERIYGFTRPRAGLGRPLAARAGPRAGDRPGRPAPAAHPAELGRVRQRRAGRLDQPARRPGRRGASRCWPRPGWRTAQVFIAEHAGRRRRWRAMVRPGLGPGRHRGRRTRSSWPRSRPPSPATRWPGWSSWCTPGAGSRAIDPELPAAAAAAALERDRGGRAVRPPARGLVGGRRGRVDPPRHLDRWARSGPPGAGALRPATAGRRLRA